MRPTEELVQEHNAILRMLEVLRAASLRLQGGAAVPVEDLDDMVSFLKGFADACHHAKEEGVLFPAMEAAGLPSHRGPTAVMCSEHELGRAYIGGMTAALNVYRTTGGGREDFVSNATAYANLLAMHIVKENTVLFPMADKLLDGQAQEELARQFSVVEETHVGAGRHDEFHRLLRRLETKYVSEALSIETSSPVLRT
jgi:hemerythrin-like domain-containing protein